MNKIKPVNDVEMDNIITKIIEDYSDTPTNDIFATINEHLGNIYSLEDFTKYLLDKDIYKKKFAVMFIEQNYARSYIGKIIKDKKLEDLF